MPKISVVMSVYNGERYLREAVESILAQTFADFEFIIVDDASTDATPQILAAYDDPRITVLHNATNLRLPASLNRGLEAATGQYIARMDADDIALPERFTRQVAFLDAHPDVGVLGTQVIKLDGQGRRIGPYQRLHTQHSLLAWSALTGSTIVHPSVMIRRDVLQQVGGYDTRWPVCEDQALWAQLMQVTRLTNLPDDLLLYRMHSASTAATHPDQQRADLYQMRAEVASRLLGRDVPPEPLAWCHQAITSERRFSEEQARAVIALLLELFPAMVHLFRPAEIGLVRAEMARQIAGVGGRTPLERVRRGDVGRIYRQRIAHPLVRRILRRLDA